jgi:hypothetical protein
MILAGRRLVCGLLAALGAWAGCSARHEQDGAATSIQQRLAPMISAPMNVGPSGGLTPDGSYTWGLACGPNQCLAVFTVFASSSSSSSTFDAQWVGMRLDRTGKLISKLAIPLPRHQSGDGNVYWVAAQGSDFLVGHSSESSADVHRVGPDGNVAPIGSDPQFAPLPSASRMIQTSRDLPCRTRTRYESTSLIHMSSNALSLDRTSHL